MRKLPFDNAHAYEQMLRVLNKETDLDYTPLCFIGDLPVSVDVAAEVAELTGEAFVGVYGRAPSFRMLFAPGIEQDELKLLERLLSLSIPDSQEEQDEPDEIEALGKLLDAFLEAASEDLPSIFFVFGKTTAGMKAAVMFYPATLEAHSCFARIREEALGVQEFIQNQK